MILKSAELLYSLHTRSGKGLSFGTFGELLQGVMEEEESDFLVTLPIDRYAHATFREVPAINEIIVTPAFKTKALKLVELFFEKFQIQGGGWLELSGNIPVGKGFASSSADLVATARALADYYNISLEIEQIENLMRQIEPSDGVMYPGIVSYYHRRVQLLDFLGHPPRLTIVAIDEGGEVDTLEFNKLPKPFTIQEKKEYGQLLERISRAIKQRDVQTIGQVSTRSALLNQKLRPKVYLDQMLEACHTIGGLGVCVAHSGTCIGIILNNEATDYIAQLESTLKYTRSLSKDVHIYNTWNI